MFRYLIAVDGFELFDFFTDAFLSEVQERAIAKLYAKSEDISYKGIKVTRYEWLD